MQREYQLTYSTDPDAAWDSLGAQTFALPQGDVQVLNGTPVYLNVRVRYVKAKGQPDLTYTPYGAADGPYTWTC